jgi:metallophosphoesterase (TIGR00282 family)
VGEPGRNAVHDLLPRLRKKWDASLVIANGENAAGGNGITPKIAEELYSCGVDVITTGDHLWDQKEVIGLLQNEGRFLRPLNYPSGTPGRGSMVWQANNMAPVAIINLQGRTFMPDLDNPFVCIRAEIEKIRQKTNIIFVDFHAEATSEKAAMGRMLDGQISALVGTHTHVQTADEQIFPGGTAFLSDAGFTGPHHSVIGRDIEPVIKRFITLQPQKFSVAKDDVKLQGVFIQVNTGTGRAEKIERISESLPNARD